MRKHKRKFEDYEEIALCLRTANQLLIHSTIIYQRAPYSDKMQTILNKLSRCISSTEDEMFADYPDRANVNVFYGGGGYRLNIRKHHDYIFSSFARDTCKMVDAFAILTRDGAVLLSDDAKVTFEEDATLSKIVKNMIWRKEEIECNKKQ